MREGGFDKVMMYVQEQEEWDGFVVDQLGADAELVRVSPSSSDCRVYRTPEAIVMIRRFTPASIRGRNNSLEDEYLIRQHLSSVTGVPAVRSYARMGEWEWLEMEPLPELCGYDPSFGKPLETFKDFWDVVQVTMQLNRLGCSHGNLHWQHIGRNVAGGISVFGFDHAALAAPWRCTLRDLLGWPTCGKSGTFSLLNRRPRLRGRAIDFVRRVKARLTREVRKLVPKTESPPTQDPHVAKSTFVSCTRLRADPALSTLAEAWTVGSYSTASAGSYYSLDIAGINFPGERPWLLRWDRIRKQVDFKGKRLLELGCNMGLLSIHAKLAGAAYCLGVDVHTDILSAASLAARGFETEVEFRQLNLSGPSPWEQELRGFDMVTALSVLNWVRNKERVWSFLARHQEVLYEGHEPEQEAERNLRQAGFTHIVRLGRSERHRHLFYASQR